ASNDCVDMSLTSDSIGKPNVHLKGRKFASVCTQSGMSWSGTSRPDNSISIVPWNMLRTKYAPQMAKMKTTICSADGCSAGWKTAESPTAIGSQSTTTT